MIPLINWKNIRRIQHSRKNYICVVCGKLISRGSSYLSKPYIPNEILDFLSSHGLSRLPKYEYINLPFCSEFCFNEISHGHNFSKYRVNIKPIIEAKLEELEHGKKVSDL